MSREMKDSGIAWIGEIPKGWIRAKYRYSGVFTKGKLPNEQNIECLGKPIIGASEMLGKECRNFSLDTNIPTCQKQDVLILWDGANAGIVANNCDGIVSSTVVKYECTDENFDSQFLFYLFKNGEHFFKSKVNGTTIPHMNQKYIDEYLCIHPPLPEQQKIAEFLDRKCAKIDELMALQEKMIEELKAYKQAVITEAVTKGLNPNAPMKDSGIAWIGEIPEHWEVCRVKNLCNLISKGATPSTIDGEAYKGSVRFIKCENIVDNKLIDNSQYYISSEINNVMKRSQLVENDVLFVIAGATIGKTAIVKKEFIPSNTNQAVSFIRLIDYNKAKLLWYILQSKVIQTPLWINAVQSAQPNLSMEDLGNFTIIVPNTTEQQQIADYLDRKCAEIDELVAVKQQKIETLKEYKKSLIYEYVTGKKEVI